MPEMNERLADYHERIAAVFKTLNISPEMIVRRALPICMEAQALVVAEVDGSGREHQLTPAAAEAWQSMKRSAHEEGISIYIVSAFRSFDRQCELVREKCSRGETMEAIFSVLAVPGYSEHHTGCAIDLSTTECKPLDEIFEQTPAFGWLKENAEQYGFMLSYPRENPSGYCYEPWHWCYHITD